MKMYAVCCKLIPSIDAMVPNKGPRWADAVGKSLEAADDVARRRIANSFSVCTILFEIPAGKALAKDRSQIDSNALPCATDALRPTVHIMAASKLSSRSIKSAGFLYAASTNGKVVEAYELREKSRNTGKEDFGRVCAMYDSRPLLKAKEPRGSAESESRRRKCCDEAASGPITC
jgi:hypothetical protein